MICIWMICVVRCIEVKLVKWSEVILLEVSFMGMIL